MYKSEKVQNNSEIKLYQTILKSIHRVDTNLFVLPLKLVHGSLQLPLHLRHLLQLLLLQVEVLLLPGHVQQRLHLGEQPPPRPVAQLQVGQPVSLDDPDGAQLLLALGKVPVRKNYYL